MFYFCFGGPEIFVGRFVGRVRTTICFRGLDFFVFAGLKFCFRGLDFLFFGAWDLVLGGCFLCFWGPVIWF